MILGGRAFGWKLGLNVVVVRWVSHDRISVLTRKDREFVLFLSYAPTPHPLSSCEDTAKRKDVDVKK